MVGEYSTQFAQAGSYTARAFAKVNLHLAVGPARADGFHELVTIFQSLDLSDTVRLSVVDSSTDSESESGDSASQVHSLVVTGNDCAAVPTDSSNLAWKAVDAVADALRAAHGIELPLPQVAVAIEKSIPVAGGMAGGSADAAAALRAANALFADHAGVAELDENVVHELAAQLGSDIPFCLHGHTALGQGRGEKLHGVPTVGTFCWALVAHEQGLSTPRVFGVFDELSEHGPQSQALAQDKACATYPSPEETRKLAAALQEGNVQRVAGLLRNDLQAAAVHVRPDLREVLRVGTQAGALSGIVSGSGPTCAFLCTDVATARQVAREVEKTIAGTRGIVATSPAGRAELIEN